jgi:predicted RNA-binding protein YlxR (DUF448 family)
MLVRDPASPDVDWCVIQRESPAAAIRTAAVRTCIGCRKRELAVELLRVVAASTGNGQYAVAVDTTRSRPGRGAWLHPDGRCLSAAIRRRAFGRALRITGPPDTSEVVEHFLLLGHPGKRTGSEEHEYTVKSR